MGLPHSFKSNASLILTSHAKKTTKEKIKLRGRGPCCLGFESTSIGGCKTLPIAIYILISQNDALSRLVFLKNFGNCEQSVGVYRTYYTRGCKPIFHYFIHLSLF